MLLPGGRKLVTLRDAADYIMKLPKAEQHLAEWQTVGRSPAPGRRTQRPNHDGAHRRLEGIEPSRSAGVTRPAETSIGGSGNWARSVTDVA